MHSQRVMSCLSAFAIGTAALVGCGADRSPDSGPRFAHVKDGMDQWSGDDWSSETPVAFNFNDVMYLQGPVMDQSGPQVYILWYGDWSKYGDVQKVVLNFLKDLSGSPYWGIPHSWKATPQNTLGYEVGDPLPGRVSTGFKFGGSTVDNYSMGPFLTEDNVGMLVDLAVSNNVLNLANSSDPNSIWLVIPSPDVGDSSGFCGYHSLVLPFANLGNGVTKYAFVATHTMLTTGCNPANLNVSPNGSPIGDAIVNVLAHEMAEALTDPNPIFDGWASLGGGPGQNEIADKCNFRFGPVYRTANGAFANMKVGSHDYLLQELLVPTSPQTCGRVAPVTDSP